MARLRPAVRPRAPGSSQAVSAATVLYLSPTAQLGGAEHSLLELASHLDTGSFRPYIACLGSGPLIQSAHLHGVRVSSIPIPPPFERTSLRGARSGPLRMAAGAVAALPVLRTVRRMCRETRPAIVHSNGNKTHLMCTPLIVGREPILIWHIRDFLKTGAVERVFARTANRVVDALVANSAAVARHAVALGFKASRVHTIPNGVDLSRFTPEGTLAPIRSEFGWAKNAPVVGVVGVLARWKGQATFLRAAHEVLRHVPHARFLVVGGDIYRTDGHGEYQSELAHLVEELGLAPFVQFAGYRTDVPAIMRALDVVVHASIDPEPFGRVIAEAMACGRPVVSTRGGGADEIVAGTSLLESAVPRGDAPAMAAAIRSLLEDPGRAEAGGLDGRRRAVEHFDIRDHARRMLELYRSLLDRRR